MRAPPFCHNSALASLASLWIIILLNNNSNSNLENWYWSCYRGNKRRDTVQNHAAFNTMPAIINKISWAKLVSCPYGLILKSWTTIEKEYCDVPFRLLSRFLYSLIRSKRRDHNEPFEKFTQKLSILLTAKFFKKVIFFSFKWAFLQVRSFCQTSVSQKVPHNTVVEVNHDTKPLLFYMKYFGCLKILTLQMPYFFYYTLFVSPPFWTLFPGGKFTIF